MKTTQCNLINTAKRLLNMLAEASVLSDDPSIDDVINLLGESVRSAEADDSIDLTDDEIDRGLGVVFLICPHYPGETEREWEERIIKEQADAFRKIITEYRKRKNDS